LFFSLWRVAVVSLSPPANIDDVSVRAPDPAGHPLLLVGQRSASAT